MQHFDGLETNLRLKLKSYVVATLRLIIIADLFDSQIKRIQFKKEKVISKHHHS